MYYKVTIFYRRTISQSAGVSFFLYILSNIHFKKFLFIILLFKTIFTTAIEMEIHQANVQSTNLNH